jgi:beta-mannosidase
VVRISLNGMWEALPASNASHGVDQLPADGWRAMPVPSNWHLAGLPNHLGTVWYRRRFGPVEGERLWLVFAGVDYQAEVYLNGVRLGAHEGYFQPFRFEVTGLLQRENDLLVRVDSPKEEPGVWPDQKRLLKGIFGHHDARPGAWDLERGQDGNTGGIWNEVFLEVTGATAIQRVKVSPFLQPDGGARLVVRVITDGPAAEMTAILRDPDGRVIGSQTRIVRQEGTYLFHVTEPRLWWTWDLGEQPLYTLTVGDHTVTFGIRDVKIDGEKRWWLNGRPFFPRGTNIIPTQWLSEYHADMIGQDVALMRGANLNAVRIHAHVNRDELYTALDRAGILVWQDFALQWSYEESEDLFSRACHQVREMVRLLENHPCVAVWCCHNEPSVNRHTLDPILAAAVREEDATRPVMEASDFTEHAYPGWYLGETAGFEALPAKPFVNEYGAQALPCREMLEEMFTPGQLWPPDWEAWKYHDFQYDETFHVAGVALGNSLDEFIANSQRYQYDLIKRATELYRRAKWQPMTGVFQFMLTDCWPAITWSVVDYRRRPKLGYEALRLAMQPVLVSLVLARRKVAPTRAYLDEVWIVNDLAEGFAGAEVRIALLDGAGKVLDEDRFTVEIAPDSCRPVAGRGLRHDRWLVPAGTGEGRYLVQAEVYHGGKLLSHNREEVEVVTVHGLHNQLL